MYVNDTMNSDTQLPSATTVNNRSKMTADGDRLYQNVTQNNVTSPVETTSNADVCDVIITTPGGVDSAGYEEVEISSRRVEQQRHQEHDNGRVPDPNEHLTNTESSHRRHVMRSAQYEHVDTAYANNQDLAHSAISGDDYEHTDHVTNYQPMEDQQLETVVDHEYEKPSNYINMVERPTIYDQLH